VSDPRIPDEPSTEAQTLDAGRRERPAPTPAPQLEIGGYRILGKLGEGGMGVVYEAEQHTPRRRVALKVVRGGHAVDEAHLKMFQREVETLARLNHPNIAAIHDAGRTDDGRHFFTMELVSGRTLSAFVRERLGGERPTAGQIRERLRLFATIARAVNYAHQRGVIHRDLKPSNLVVGDAGEVKVLDFGLARVTDSDVAMATVVSEIGVIKGTLPYMSPEQTRGDSRDIDLRTDVYSLGVILYELLAGRQPYDTTNSLVQAVKTICETPPRPLEAAGGGMRIDADLRTIVGKALEKEPDARYQSAGALADDVERYLANQPILAHPPSTMYQLRKLVARHRGRVAALATIGVLLVALLVSTLVQARRVRLERDRATAEASKSAAINRFLIDALGAADPWSRGSRSVTLADALHRAQARARDAFADQPLIEAEVLQSLGGTFGSLAEFAEADTALRAALALREQAAGRHSPEVATSLMSLVTLYLRWQRFPDAEPFAREALAIARRVHGPASVRTAAAMTNVAIVCAKTSRYDEADSLAREAVRITGARAGEGPHDGTELDPTTVQGSALSVLSELAMVRNDAAGMVAVNRRRMALAEGPGGGRPMDLVTVLNDLAASQMISGDLAAAESTYVRGLELARRTLGDEHPTVAMYLENLGNVHFRQGRLDQTALQLEQVLAVRRRALGDDSEPVARTMANMATVYARAGDVDRAVRIYREAVPRLAAKLGPDHPDVGMTWMGMGNALRRQKRFAESESALLRAEGILVHALGEEARLPQFALNSLAQLYTEWGRPAQAAKYAARVKPAS
jgi:serine/threonine protein kinase